MFSIYPKGIKNVNPVKRPITLSDLAKLIRNNPAAITIDQIRKLRENGDQTYKVIKRALTYITPNCVLKKRSLNDLEFNENFNNNSSFKK